MRQSGGMAKIEKGRREHWARLVEEQSKSGQSAQGYCRQRGVSKQSFYAWRRRLREGEPGMSFALVARGGELEPAGALELTLASGERLKIGAGCGEATLRMVLGVLHEAR